MAPSSRSIFSRLIILLTSLLHLTHAQTRQPASASASIGGGLAFAVNVPSNSSNALFINYRIPNSRTTWGAFGFGSSMSNALMFIAYASEANNGKVTVSPRISTSQTMPRHDDSITFTDMGSGMINGSFVVRGMCENCRQWSGGSVDTTSEEQPMLWGSGPAGSLASDDLSARISVHQAKGRFSIDMRNASGEPGVPQFQLEDTQTSDDSSRPVDSDDSGFFDKAPMIIAHALLMIFAFLILFPGGYAVLRLLDKVLIHAGVQSLAALVVIIGSALGLAASKNLGIYPNINTPHQIIGLIVLALVLVTLVIGAAGHAIYRKTGAPAKFMIAHRVLGPATIGLGLVNVIVGFRLAGHYRPIIGFAILTLLIFTAITALVLLKRRRQVRKGAMNTPAAMNFREGGFANGGAGGPPAYGGNAAPGGYGGQGPAIPLQSYNQGPPRYQ